jgi:hypothetical protein
MHYRIQIISMQQFLLEDIYITDYVIDYIKIITIMIIVWDTEGSLGREQRINAWGRAPR